MSAQSIASVITYNNESNFQSAASNRFTLVNLDAPPLNQYASGYRVEDAAPSSNFASLGVDFQFVNAQVVGGQANQIPKAGRDRLILNGIGFDGNIAFDIRSPANGIGAWSNFIDGGTIKAYDGRGLTGNLLGVANLNGGSFGGLISDSSVIRSAQITCDFNYDLKCGVFDIQHGSSFSFSDVIRDAVTVTPSGSTITAKFQPKFGLTLAETAALGDYDHFNWRQTVTAFPHSDDPGRLTATGIGTPFTDPPLGYLHRPAAVDALPFYWREEGDPFNPVSCLRGLGGDVFRSCNQGPFTEFFDPSFLTFFDQPVNSLIELGESMDFVTELVGIRIGGGIDVLNTFTWSSDYTGSSGRVSTFATAEQIETGGSGGIFNLRTNVPTVVPEPSTASLLVAALWGLIGIRRISRNGAQILRLLVSALPNNNFKGTAGKLRLPVRSGLRPAPAPQVER